MSDDNSKALRAGRRVDHDVGSSVDRKSIIRQRLETGLIPDSLEITDDSHLHIGHAGAQGGAGHYSVQVTSQKFNDLNRIKRHQLVYACVNDMIPDEIHALSIEAFTPEEALALKN